MMPVQQFKTDVEAMVIGGGPAGAAAACHLARQGRTIAVLEQSVAPQHKVCGEFLSQEAAGYLQELEIEPESLGAMPVHGVRLSAGKRIIATDLPFPAWSITRQRLDEELLMKAARCGAQVLRGHRVESLDYLRGVWSATLSERPPIQARDAFLATGKHDLRGHKRPQRVQDDFVAFKMYWRVSPLQQNLLHGWVELFLFPGGYAGLQLTEDFDANLCLLIRRKVLHRCNNDWSALLGWIMQYSEPLAERLDGATPLLARPLAISSIPFGLLRSRSDAGLWLLGDQAAVIPSFSGDGISIALHSAKAASVLYGNSGTPGSLAQLLHRQLRRPFFWAGLIGKLMTAVPDLAVLAEMWPKCLGYIAAQTRIPQMFTPEQNAVRQPAPRNRGGRE